VNAERHQLVAIGYFQSRRTQICDELRIHIEDAECDQFVGIEIVEVFILHLSREFQTDILHGHAELLFIVHGKTETLHFARVVGIGMEMENAGALSIVEKTFAVDFAGVTRNSEVHILAA